MNLKIAYLVIAHDNYEHLKRMITALNDVACTFYIHIDKRSAFPVISGDNIIYLEKRVAVHWGGFSMVMATLNLLRRALEDDNDYFALISGTDYPIKPNKWLFEKINGGGEYIAIKKGFDTYNPLSRYKYFYFTDFYNRRDKSNIKTKIFLWFQNLLRKIKVQKSIPFQLYTGTQWFVLSRSCVSYILNFVVEKKDYIRFFQFAFCPDECFFQTIIGNSEFYHSAKETLTYADWSVDPGPAIINEKHIEILKNENEKFFVRKFNDESTAVVELIDKMLRNTQSHHYEHKL